MYTTGDRFWCPICDWSGSSWARVQTKPDSFEEKACPSCGCYPRERLQWISLASLQIELGRELKILEIGGTRRFGGAARRSYFYRNVDIVADQEHVDYVITEGVLPSMGYNFDCLLISYVLSMIPRREDRIKLVSDATSYLHKQGKLIFYDDMDLSLPTDIRHPEGEYFHCLRLGRSILDELEQSGWKVLVISDCGPECIGAAAEMPYLIGARVGN